ncbi:MAG: ATP-binding protein [Catenulisporales bacterium]|nr:ATP-binding protein [Catenulisporales bacterium]
MGVVMSVKPESPRDSAEISETVGRGQAQRPAGSVSGTEFPHTPESVGAARHALCNALQRMRIAPPAADDAVLILSELVSNALRHALPLSGGTIRVAWWMEDNRVLRIAVTDGGRQSPEDNMASFAEDINLRAADLDEVDESAVDGRGLGIVGLLADAWGVEPCPVGDAPPRANAAGEPKTVWAAVRLHARHAAAPPPPSDPPRRWWRRLGLGHAGDTDNTGRTRGLRGAWLGGARLGRGRGGREGDSAAGPAGSDTAWVPRYPTGVRMAGAS